ncbi:hypothetical protein [Streptomyces incarnatus]|uniref:hypothetical protein n=1 Tax=Streptomyces incarnatus TaxID=665007 RepID=UPI000A4A1ED3|nr:hypothetical protein [Streptomyces incarnatus]
MPSRTFAVVGAGVGAAVLAAAGITYASTVGAGSSTVASAPAAPSVHRAAASVHRAAKPAHPAAKPVSPAAKPVQRAAPAAASSGDKGAGGDRSEGRDGGGRGHGRGHGDGGRIYFNDRAYSASAEGCITTGGGLGSGSFSVFNDSRKFIEVFRGFNCDNGGPVAVVGPHGETSGVVTRTGHEGLFGFGDDGVVGSFRVICDRDEW